MNYLEALAQNRKYGVRIRRISWDPEVFLAVKDGEVTWDAGDRQGTPFHSRKGMLADDWEVEVRTVAKEVPVFEWTSELPTEPGFYAIRATSFDPYIREVIPWAGKLVVSDLKIDCADYASARPGLQWCFIDPARFSAVIE